MLAFIGRRLALGVLLVFAVIFAVFLLAFAVGDPAAATLGPNASAEAKDDFRKREGLDEPLLTQFGSYLGLSRCVRGADDGEVRYCGLLQGDMGESYGHRESVAKVIAYRLPRTILLGLMALVFELILGLGVGLLAAVKRNTWVDATAMGTAFVGISLPTYVTGPLLLIVFGFLYGWFPLGGYGTGFWDHVYHGVMPAFTLAIFGAATYARIMRSEMIENLRSDFVRTARAKGLSETAVVLRHAARNSLLPVVTLLGLSLRALVSGAIITEAIFNWPGMGLLTVEATLNLDAPTLMGVVVVFSFVVLVGNLLADVTIALLDPRIRLQQV